MLKARKKLAKPYNPQPKILELCSRKQHHIYNKDYSLFAMCRGTKFHREGGQGYREPPTLKQNWEIGLLYKLSYKWRWILKWKKYCFLPYDPFWTPSDIFQTLLLHCILRSGLQKHIAIETALHGPPYTWYSFQSLQYERKRWCFGIDSSKQVSVPIRWHVFAGLTALFPIQKWSIYSGRVSLLAKTIACGQVVWGTAHLLR